ncbi:hypothetical protein Moror_8440 [Moniliophthora roreri MCA 2997]|uniref:Uncharacterized protein n=1 Tax=Moniliophthora roreri (strain MCA 2997) TaxID=1381753 RepID=V2WK62_MONRO|nr:hypothetical protein Moror_8440 [Moniliophthora roreri MCA 2997]
MTACLKSVMITDIEWPPNTHPRPATSYHLTKLEAEQLSLSITPSWNRPHAYDSFFRKWFTRRKNVSRMVLPLQGSSNTLTPFRLGNGYLRRAILGQRFAYSQTVKPRGVYGLLAPQELYLAPLQLGLEGKLSLSTNNKVMNRFPNPSQYLNVLATHNPSHIPSPIQRPVMSMANIIAFHSLITSRTRCTIA